MGVFLFPTLAFANEWRAYDRAAFVEAQKAGKTIFVSVHAFW